MPDERRNMAKPKEVADFLGVGVQTLADWRADRRGPAYHKAGAAVRYLWSDVERWLAETKVQTRELESVGV